MAKSKFLAVLTVAILLAGCNEKFPPKPRGYFRIDFPEKKYTTVSEPLPYRFDIPVYSVFADDTDKNAEPFWKNITVPAFKADIHISYKTIGLAEYKKLSSENLPQKQALKAVLSRYAEESRRLAYDHSIKADAIEENIFMNPAQKVYGTIYRIQGNAASPIQFYLTDSVKHFLRGSLYIREVPNIDSLKPVVEFLETDILRLIETTTWN